MTIKKFKIISEFIKDMSSETPDVQTYLFIKENISKYHLNIEIDSKAIKDKVIEINTMLKFVDNEPNEKKGNFEMIYTTIAKIEDDIKEKKDLQKIILCDVQKEIYPRLEKSFLNMLSDSGYSGIKFEKKIDFDKLYKEKFN
ncbi:protein-export chaperone SecB [Candidatus Pelagibacter sp.]|jgi:preprotein translocase subunit SecB|nr:protein-export chaperone SecB [Candidatus Pelagibacter sp.]|tara:strand:- start:181 stop:606 length:426 start_codon:yes stop_codon:yes gene_type:complete